MGPGPRWTVPWQWGTTGVAVNTSVYDGDIHTSEIWLDPPPELVGKVNVVPEMQDVINLAILYVGGEPCTDDREVLKKTRDVLVAAKPNWMSMDYGMTEKLSSADVAASVNWNGSTFRARLPTRTSPTAIRRRASWSGWTAWRSSPTRRTSRRPRRS